MHVCETVSCVTSMERQGEREVGVIAYLTANNPISLKLPKESQITSPTHHYPSNSYHLFEIQNSNSTPTHLPTRSRHSSGLPRIITPDSYTPF